jgi:hypothetical protein
VAQSVGPEFKTQYCKTNKQNTPFINLPISNLTHSSAPTL